MAHPHHATSGLSSVALLSSTHGRMRRAQRLIEKKDLKAAVKYGKQEISFNQRGLANFKYTFADIVYITDLTSTKEIRNSCNGVRVSKVLGLFKAARVSRSCITVFFQQLYWILRRLALPVQDSGDAS